MINQSIFKPTILKTIQRLLASGSLKVVDLSHKVNKFSPTWDGGCGFLKKDMLKYGNDLFCVQNLNIFAGIETHMDSPAHLFEGSNDISSINISTFFSQICIIDIRNKVKKDKKYKMTLEDVENYEKNFGTLPNGSLLVALTGWSQYWSNPTLYRNVDDKGIMSFPGITKNVAEKYITKLNNGMDLPYIQNEKQMLIF